MFYNAGIAENDRMGGHVTVDETVRSNHDIANYRIEISPSIGKIFRQSSENSCKIHKLGV